MGVNSMTCTVRGTPVEIELALEEDLERLCIEVPTLSERVASAVVQFVGSLARDLPLREARATVRVDARNGGVPTVSISIQDDG